MGTDERSSLERLEVTVESSSKDRFPADDTDSKSVNVTKPNVCSAASRHMSPFIEARAPHRADPWLDLSKRSFGQAKPSRAQMRLEWRVLHPGGTQAGPRPDKAGALVNLGRVRKTRPVQCSNRGTRLHKETVLAIKRVVTFQQW